MDRSALLGRLILITWLALSLSACGAPLDANGKSATQSPSPETSSLQQYDDVDQDWSNPIAGIRVATTDEAQDYLPFELVIPVGLGEPQKVFVSDPLFVTREQTVVAFLYQTQNYGLVVIKEHFPDVPVESYDKENEELLKYNGLPVTHGSFSLVSVRGGEQALLTTSEDATEATLFWLENGLEFIIEGPNLDADAVIDLSARI